jgi:hypothetical protein
MSDVANAVVKMESVRQQQAWRSARWSRRGASSNWRNARIKPA